MLTDMLAVIKSFIGTMRSSFFIIDKVHIGDHIQADMWDDGWSAEQSAMPKKRNKINLSTDQTPAGLVARTGKPLNVRDAFKDPRFLKEIDPVTGTVVRSCLLAPVMDKDTVIGVVQLTNKTNFTPFNSEDEKIFDVFVNYCSLIVHFYNMQQQKIFHENLNKVFGTLMGLHLKPCRHELEELMESNGVVLPSNNFRSYDFHISECSKEDMPGLLCYMFVETFADGNFERRILADFVLTILSCYRQNPYHNAEHAFCFTHTMYMILSSNPGYFDFVETAALMLGGICHDLDHPGFNNNFLIMSRHPLAQMYKTSTLEHHHFFLAKHIIEEKKLLALLSIDDRDRILQEMKYNILCTDLALYFQLRAQLSPLLADGTFEWTDNSHRKMLKGILMTTSDLSGCCKPFGVSKAIAECVYEEFYNQGDKEREMGYHPLSMMDRNRRLNQPAEQIQFLSVVIIPCLMMLQTLFPNTSPLMENCKKTQEAWHEEIEIRGQKLWRQEDSVRKPSRGLVQVKTESSE
ncbi:cAMP and cAMP-inhibited cGMP 3',5'-cyclic phosphodiesterase 10A-like isoform X2 [Leptidea sinapis]|nr:cAMP and cAMP-inhibited cGMP 3',5'-cyclic phosphodiesterase 10A-like isoform X2 [Leptidea sinapis]